ncbi:GerAB/ArcD/ProY family transporter [Bacillus sp. M6-12]|uniref:GerAB/ArcD/ProY family transporter n=1 Tax=Bacillus sp. M6-12 TaxID=2054166 RepID=UPI0015E0ECF2|nr:endospore germination permease [Bacillus sp. M6-12]
MKEKLHSFHLTILIYLIQTGVVLFILPGTLAKTFGTNGWLAILPVSAMMIINIILIGAVFRLGKGKPFFAIVEEGIPRLVVVPIYIFLIILWSLLGCLTGKQYIAIFQVFSFQHSPSSLLKLMYDVLLYFLVIKGIYNIAKASTIIFSITIFLFILFFYFFPDLEMVSFTPFLFQNGDGWTSGVFDTYVAFLGAELSLLFFPYVNKESKFIRSVILGNLLTTFVYVYSCFLIFGVFGYDYIKNLRFPLMQLLSLIEFPFIERLENLLYCLFMLKVLITTAMFIWAATEAAKRIFPNKGEKSIAFLIVLGVYLISFIPETLDQIASWMKFLASIEIVISYTLPIIAILLLFIRKKGRKKEHG